MHIIKSVAFGLLAGFLLSGAVAVACVATAMTLTMIMEFVQSFEFGSEASLVISIFVFLGIAFSVPAIVAMIKSKEE